MEGQLAVHLQQRLPYSPYSPCGRRFRPPVSAAPDLDTMSGRASASVLGRYALSFYTACLGGKL